MPVAEFLHFNLNRRMSPEAWARSIRAPWKASAPNHGFLLRADDGVVGAYIAFYSERIIDGRPERFCNLGAWCVLREFRLHSLRLLKALLAQDGYHFTDLSPGSHVMALNNRLKFERLDTTTAMIPHLPWPSLPGRGRISCDPAVIENTLTGPELDLYRDHADAPAARHLVLATGNRWCYVMFRKDRRKSLRRMVFLVSILHVSNPDLFHSMLRPLARHLLLRHGALGSLAELRVIGRQPRFSELRPDFRPKMFRSTHLTADQIDNLYSELVCVPW
jgi:hypothetical protein